MKKILLMFMLISYTYIIPSQHSQYYAFYVHIMPLTNSDVNSSWQQSSSLCNALAQYCQKNTDESAQGFCLSQKKAIETVKEIFVLNNSINPLLQISTKILVEPFTIPNDGLLISFEYMLDKSCPLENLENIHTLLTELKINCDQKNQKLLMSKLENLNIVFNLSSGQSILSVQNLRDV